MGAINNPITYIIPFFILVIVALITITWIAYLGNQVDGCATNPEIWCRDDWKCESNCSNHNVSCYNNGNAKTGLASCIFGPDSQLAKILKAYNDNDTDAVQCITSMKDANNCFNGCAGSKNMINKNTCSSLRT